MTEQENHKKLNKKIISLVFLACIALSFLTYIYSVKGDFIYDDNIFVNRSDLMIPYALLEVWNRPYFPENITAGTYRPLTVFSFAFNFLSFGSASTSFHVVNIILNGLVLFLIFILVFALFGNMSLALLTAGIFAVLPIHAEAVAFIKSRDEILATVFFLLSFLAFLKSRKKELLNYGWLLVSGICFILAILSKEVFLTIPLLFAAYELITRKPRLENIWRIGIVFFLVFVPYMLQRYIVLGNSAFGRDDTLFSQNPIKYASFWTGIWTAFKIAFIYIFKTIVPFHLSTNYTFNQLTLVHNPLLSGEALGGALLLALFIYLLCSKKTRTSPVGIGILIFLIPYIMISKFIFRSSTEILEEHFFYLPSIGLSLVMAWIFLWLIEKYELIGKVLLGVVLAVYVTILINRNSIFLNNDNFFQNMVISAPNSARAHLFMGEDYYGKGQLVLAEQEINKGLSIYSEDPQLLDMKGRILSDEQKFSEAIEVFKKEINISSDLNYELHLTLALVKNREYQEAYDTIRPVYIIYSQVPDLRFVMALVYYKLGNPSSVRYLDWPDDNKTLGQKLRILQDF